jgi:hypothetical protein
MEVVVVMGGGRRQWWCWWPVDCVGSERAAGIQGWVCITHFYPTTTLSTSDTADVADGGSGGSGGSGQLLYPCRSVFDGETLLTAQWCAAFSCYGGNVAGLRQSTSCSLTGTSHDADFALGVEEEEEEEEEEWEEGGAEGIEIEEEFDGFE